VRDKRPGVRSRAKIESLRIECEGVEAARWKFEMGLPAEVFETSFNDEII
jgi:hypothetical protein